MDATISTDPLAKLREAQEKLIAKALVAEEERKAEKARKEAENMAANTKVLADVLQRLSIDTAGNPPEENRWFIPGEDIFIHLYTHYDNAYRNNPTSGGRPVRTFRDGIDRVDLGIDHSQALPDDYYEVMRRWYELSEDLRTQSIWWRNGKDCARTGEFQISTGGQAALMNTIDAVREDLQYNLDLYDEAQVAIAKADAEDEQAQEWLAADEPVQEETDTQEVEVIRLRYVTREFAPFVGNGLRDYQDWLNEMADEGYELVEQSTTLPVDLGDGLTQSIIATVRLQDGA